MLTVMMECQDHEAELAHTLASLVPAAVEGLVSDVIVLDHGSRDGSARVADAAGCRFHDEWELPDIVSSARGEWLLLVEPGARIQQGWADEVHEHISLKATPARFAMARRHLRPFLNRILVRPTPLERGVLVSKGQVQAPVGSGKALSALAAGLALAQLSSE